MSDYGSSTSTGAYSENSNDEQLHFTEAQLAQMLAPIALYPDSLLTHILIAATYPLEVIEAHRWRSENKYLTDEQLQRKIDEKDWDISVKALVPFEQILSQMNDDLVWMRQLGDAFLAQEEAVLASIQYLRAQAHEAGSLSELENVTVEKDDKNIVIVSASPKVIYVPYYDTHSVYGYWRWSHYPPVHWPAHYVYHHRPIGWHSGVHIGVGFFFSAVHWHHRYVVVNHHKPYHYRKRHHIISSGYTKRWHHKPVHRKGVAYRSHQVKNKYKHQSVATHRYVSHQGKVKRNEARLVRTGTKHSQKAYKVKQFNKKKPSTIKHQMSRKNSVSVKAMPASSHTQNMKRTMKKERTIFTKPRPAKSGNTVALNRSRAVKEVRINNKPSYSQVKSKTSRQKFVKSTTTHRKKTSSPSRSRKSSSDRKSRKH